MIDDCPECGSSNVTRKRGESFCSDCGTVLESERVDTSKEYRVFDEQDKKKKRSGGNITYTRDDKGMGTEIGNNSDMYNVPGSKRGKYYRMKKWDKRSQSSGAREMFSMVQNMTSALDLPESIAEESGRMILKVREADIVRGRSKRVISASIVYLVARNSDVPRTVNEFSNKVDIPKDKLCKNYRYMAREMDLDIKPIDPVKLVPRFARRLDLDGTVEAKVRDVIESARGDNLTMGRKPASVVSGAIYYVSYRDDLEITQKSVSDACDVTNVTVRTIYKMFDEELGESQKEVSVKNVA